MNFAHLHLMLNHIPVFGTAVGLSLMIYSFVAKSDEVRKIALGVFFLSAITTIAVYLSGEPAEEIVENLPGVSEAIIETHEDAALYALVFMQITGFLALINMLVFSRSYGRKFIVATTISAVVAMILILWTANLGGEIRHTEIRSGNTQRATPEKNAESHDETETDDDDN